MAFFVDARSGLGDEFFEEAAQFADNTYSGIEEVPELVALKQKYQNWVMNGLLTDTLQSNPSFKPNEVETWTLGCEHGFGLGIPLDADVHVDGFNKRNINFVLRVLPSGSTRSTVVAKSNRHEHKRLPVYSSTARETLFDIPPDGFATVFNNARQHAGYNLHGLPSVRFVAAYRAGAPHFLGNSNKRRPESLEIHNRLKAPRSQGYIDTKTAAAMRAQERRR